MYPIIHLYIIDISSYNLCLGLGFIIGILLFLENSETSICKRDQDTILAILGISFVTAILFAFLHNKIANFISWQDFFSHFFKSTGLAYLGGLIGGVLVFCILFLIFEGHKYKLSTILNLLTPSLLIGHIIGRFGCLMSGCCYGLPSFKYGLIFSANTPAYDTYGSTPLIPTQLIEIITLMVIFFSIYNHKNNAFSLYLILYSVSRFLLEYLRGDPRGKGLFMLTPAQTICIFLFIFGNCLFINNVYKSPSHIP